MKIFFGGASRQKTFETASFKLSFGGVSRQMIASRLFTLPHTYAEASSNNFSDRNFHKINIFCPFI